MLPRIVSTLALLLLPSCSPSGVPTEVEGRWEVARYGNACAAIWQNAATTVALTITDEPNMAGINVVAAPVAFARDGRFEPDVGLTVEGREIPTTVIGVAPPGHPGLLFRMDPRPLVERYPDGLDLSVTRRGSTILHVQLRGSGEAFRDLRTCAGELGGGRTGAPRR